MSHNEPIEPTSVETPVETPTPIPVHKRFSARTKMIATGVVAAAAAAAATFALTRSRNEDADDEGLEADLDYVPALGAEPVEDTENPSE